MDPAEARPAAHRLWRTDPVPGQLAQKLPLREHFEQAAQPVSEESVAEAIPCVPDPELIIATLDRYYRAGR